MYYYIINPAAGDGKINKIQDKLRSRLTELGIAGEFVKITGPGDIPKLTEIGIKKGYNTIVAIGDDEIANEVLNNLPNDKIAFGIIPFGEPSTLAASLGIPDWQSACQILANRKTIKINIGTVACKTKIKYFVGKVAIGLEAEVRRDFPIIPKKKIAKVRHGLDMYKIISGYSPKHTSFEIDGCLKGETEALNINISNISLSGESPSFKMSILESLPKKERLALIKSGNISMITDSKNDTIIYGNEIEIKATGMPIAADDQYFEQTPALIKIADRKARIIVGSINS